MIWMPSRLPPWSLWPIRRMLRAWSGFMMSVTSGLSSMVLMLSVRKVRGTPHRDVPHPGRSVLLDAVAPIVLAVDVLLPDHHRLDQRLLGHGLAGKMVLHLADDRFRHREGVLADIGVLCAFADALKAERRAVEADDRNMAFLAGELQAVDLAQRRHDA